MRKGWCSVVILIGLLLIVVINDLGVSLLDQGESETLSLWQRDGWGLSVSNDVDVGDSGGEVVTLGVLDVGDVEGSWDLLNGLEDADSSNVVATSEHDGGSILELVDSTHLSGGEVQLKSRL